MSIKINAITTAINQMVDGFLSFEDAAAKVREFRAAERLDADTARTYIQTALCAKKPTYKSQLTENGKPAQDSALQKAVSRMMRATDPDKSEGSGQKVEKAELDIPADIMAAAMKLAKLCDEYKDSAKLASTALATARAELKK